MWRVWLGYVSRPAASAPPRCGALQLIRRRRGHRRGRRTPCAARLWIQPCGFPVRWWAIDTSALSSRSKLPQLPMHRWPRPPRREAVRLSQLLFLPAPQQVSHLIGVEQAGDAEIVGLLIAARRGRGAERRAVRRSPDPIRRPAPSDSESRCPFRSARTCAARQTLRRPRTPCAACQARGCAGFPSHWPAAAGLGTDGRKMLAVSPGLRDQDETGRSPVRRTRGVDRAGRINPDGPALGTSTPSEHHPHRDPASGRCQPRTG